MSELRNLKSRIDELESELRERDEEVRALKQEQGVNNGGGADEKGLAVSIKLKSYFHCKYYNL